MSDRGLRGTPDPDAYGRVTDAQRFAPLHQFAEALLRRLAEQFDVMPDENAAPALALAPAGPVALKSIRLEPRTEGAADLVVTFTDFPGLHVRFGRHATEAFPACGCDACAEDCDSEAERLAFMVSSLTAGRFREELSGGIRPEARCEFWSEDGTVRTARSTIVEHGSILRTVHEWQPWRPLDPWETT